MVNVKLPPPAPVVAKTETPGVYPVPPFITAPKVVTTPALISGPVTVEPTTGSWSSEILSINKVNEAAVVCAASALVIIIFSPNIIW